MEYIEMIKENNNIIINKVNLIYEMIDNKNFKMLIKNFTDDIINLIINNNFHLKEINFNHKIENYLIKINQNIIKFNSKSKENINNDNIYKKYNKVNNKLTTLILENRSLKTQIDLSTNNINPFDFSKRVSVEVETNKDFIKISKNDVIEMLNYIKNKINDDEFEIFLADLIQNTNISFQQKYDKLNDLFINFLDYIESIFNNIKYNTNNDIKEFFLTEDRNDNKETIKNNNNDKLSNFDTNNPMKQFDLLINFNLDFEDLKKSSNEQNSFELENNNEETNNLLNKIKENEILYNLYENRIKEIEIEIKNKNINFNHLNIELKKYLKIN